MSLLQLSLRSTIFLTLWGCANDELGFIVPEFALVDDNPNSATFEEEILPRDYLGSVTGWYFGHGD